jgi:endo-1,4-beta-xylanase
MKRGIYGFVLIAAMVMLIIYAAGCTKKNSDDKTLSGPDVTVTTVPEKADDTKPEEEPGKPAGEEEKEEEDEGPAAHYGIVEVNEEIIFSNNFDDGIIDFIGRGAAKTEIVTDKAAEGTGSMFISKRTEYWNGAIVDLTDIMKVNETYIVRAQVMYENGPANVQIDCKLEKNNEQYLSFASAVAKKGEWTPITGSIIVPEDTTSAEVYFETVFTGGEMIDFYVDEVVIFKENAVVNRGELPSLKEIYKDNFSMGVAVSNVELSPARKELIAEQFNSLTAGNELKPDSLLDYATCISDPKYNDNPAVKFDRAKPILDFAQKNGIKFRGHTLVWHSQTPRWFFAEGYSTDASAPLVSGELMLKRMENYIKQVLEYTQTNYPGLIYAWDVVNEAVNPGDNEENFLRTRDSLWYQVIGSGFIEKAFEYARKYADKDVKLFYNDYKRADRRYRTSVSPFRRVPFIGGRGELHQKVRRAWT